MFSVRVGLAPRKHFWASSLRLIVVTTARSEGEVSASVVPELSVGAGTKLREHKEDETFPGGGTFRWSIATSA